MQPDLLPFDIDVAVLQPHRIRDRHNTSLRATVCVRLRNTFAVEWDVMGTASATLYSVNGPISKDLALVPDTRELRIRLHEAATGEGLRARVSDDVAKPLSSESMIWVMPTNLRLEGDVIVCDVPADSAPTP